MKVVTCGKPLLPLFLEIKGKRLELLKHTTLGEGTPRPEDQSSAAGGVSELRKGADGNRIQISGGKVLVEWC